MIVPIFRSPHSTAYTARGVANGVFWGLTPTVGFQTLLLAMTWFVSRRVFRKDSSLLQAMVWTWINNPLTALPLYYTFYLTGLWFMGRPGLAMEYDAFALDFATLVAVAQPLLIGCVPYALLGSAFSYRWARAIVRRRKVRIAERRRVLREYGTFRM